VEGMGKESKVIIVQGAVITVSKIGDEDYISLTDMMKVKDGEFLLQNWLRNRNTIEFLGIWERLHNQGFNSVEFDRIKSQAGLNSFRPSVKKWIEETGAIGLKSKPGRYGGTYAHKDIAFEFGMWISPEFKLYLIREFDRLKREESKRLSVGWDLQRTLAKINYRIHTDAIREHIIPPEVTKAQANFTYAREADLLNVALFGQTAAQWRDENSSEGKKVNIRDSATLEQLVVLSNLESINALLIEQDLPQNERLLQLNKTAITQMKSLIGNNHIRQLSSNLSPIG